MRLGVVSDTHGFFDPRLWELLGGVEAILHAGDVDTETILDELERIAPVHAVRGNVDPTSLDLPLSRTLRFENVQVEMRHILPVAQSELETWAQGASLAKTRPQRHEDFLRSFDAATRVMIFGHSHQPCLVTLPNTLFFNPGSAGKKRFSLPCTCGVLEILPEGIRGSIRSLEGERESLPAPAWLPIIRSGL